MTEETLAAGAAFAKVEFRGVVYNVCVPNADEDYIQGRLAETGRPYEEEMLEAMADLLKPGDLVADVGANIGNHSLALAMATKCRAVSWWSTPTNVGAGENFFSPTERGPVQLSRP